jgi:hypothetical protein
LIESGLSWVRSFSRFSSQLGWPGVKMAWANIRRDPASLFTLSRAAAAIELVRNQSAGTSDGADEISDILVSLSRNISFL